MTHKIKLLPDTIINKIAAGEVVERPASIVKELVENSIDAKANKIKIEIKNAGQKLIKVSDNGEGLTRDDLLLAFERHATSKISDINDLYSITTLGFRGEALPSIASVSKIRTKSKTINCNIGFEIFLEGGVIKNVSEVAINPGFTIEVRDIFFNVPARLKFLKKPATENAYIDNVVKRFLLSNPLKEFTFISNNRTKFYPKCKNIIDRIEQIYSENISSKLIPFTIEDEEFYISGYVSPPDITTAYSNDVSIFLNGRFIKDRTIYFAIKEAYKGKIFEKRYPYIFLYINIDPAKVDINVHPAKLEVKFHNSQRLFNLIRNNIQTVISCSSISFEKPTNDDNPIDSFDKFKNFIKSSIEKYRVKEDIDLGIHDDLDEDITFEKHFSINTVETETNFYKSLDYIGNFLDTFLIFKKGESIYIIDQHAAHERIQLEKLKSNLSSGQKIVKKLLMPEILDISENEKAILLKFLDKINQLGVFIEQFDEKTLVLKGMPAMLEHIDPKELIEILIKEFEYKNSSHTIDEINEKILASIACKSAIKAGTRLDTKNISFLLKELDSVPNNRTCPHGRPILIEITRNEIFKRFKRT
jgi:DNA mismatch repair protein MutL